MTTHTRSETFFRGSDQNKLFLQTWFCKDAVGTIFFTHGHGEHSDSYHRLISGLDQMKDAQKWNFVGWDMRGFGKSEGSRGYAKDFSDYVLDYDHFMKKAMTIDFVKNKPVILFSHSMGGLVQICALLENNYVLSFPQIIGQILSAPLTGVAVHVPSWKEVGANLFNQVLPKLALDTGLKNEMLTRDPEVIREFERDTYRHLKMSSGVYLGMKQHIQKIFLRASELTIPTLLIMSDSDPVNSSSEALKFFDLMSSTKKSLKIFDNAKHELINDTCRNDVYKTINEFLQQLGGSK